MAFEPLPLNEETLANLLNEGTERDGLDFKSVCDLKNAVDKVELAKDVGAMQMRGGYVVIGADDRGRPTGEVTDAHAKLFDQATLHDKVKPYLADGFEIRSTALKLDGNLYGLICVLPHEEGIAPFKANGFYKDDKNRDKMAFRAGDVFTRRGTRSEPWNHEDIRYVLTTIRRQEREAARTELQQDFTAMQQAAQRATAAAEAPATTLRWNVDVETLTAAITEQLRRADDIPLISLIKSAPRAAIETLRASGFDDFESLLDRVASVIARLLLIERRQYAERAIDALQAIYNATFDANGFDRQDLGVHPAAVHLAVVTRVQAVGALAVRERDWSTARYLVQRPITQADAGYWGTWLFHGEVNAARANLLRDPERAAGKSPLVIAQEHIARLSDLRPDIAADDEEVITSLCQFDILAAFATISFTERGDAFLAYFGQWYAQRSDPIVVELIRGGEIREIVFPDDDDTLAAAVRAIAYNASRMAMSINGWRGWSAPEIARFLEAHPEPADTAFPSF